MFLRKPHPYSSNHMSCHCGQIAQSLSRLTMKLLSRSHLSCRQPQISVWVWRFHFWRTFVFGWYPLSPKRCKTSFTVDNDSGVPAVSSLWQAWILVVPDHPNQFPLIGGWQFRSINHTMATWRHICIMCIFDLDICSCLEMTPKKHPNLCKSTVLLRSLMNSLDFLDVLNVGQSNDYCQINPFYAGKQKLPVVFNHDH